MVGILNAHMFGAATEPGEYIDWSEPDYNTPEEWAWILGMPVESFAAISPHMIVFDLLEA